MQLYPAIDLRDGRCVRLYQGDFSRETVYGDDPVAQARRFADAGARWIHVVDLDAARTGAATNRAPILEIAAAVGAAVQVSGGVRDHATVTALLEGGISRVVIGTWALEDPDAVATLASRHPGRLAVGLDARLVDGRRELAVRGWTAGSGQDLTSAVRRFDGTGVAALVVTDIGRDGTLVGPDVEGLAEVLEATDRPVVASGGVGGLDDLRRLAEVEVSGRRLAGAIVGRALYEGAFSLEEALAAVGGT